MRRMVPLSRKSTKPAFAVFAIALAAVLVQPALLCAAADIAVPKVIGMAGTQAKQVLERAGFKVKLVENHTVTANRSLQGKVSAQVPEAGRKTAKGSTVAVYTYHYKPEVAVPKVVGMTVDQARLTLERAGLRFKLANQPTATTNQALAGKVAAQNPAAGAKARMGSTVMVSPYVLKTPPPMRK